MKDYARGGQRLASTLIAGFLLACPTVGAQALSGQGSDNYAFRGTVTGTGDIRDASGNIVGRVVMTNPGARFDVSTMSINAQGNVVDTNGVPVGRMVLNTSLNEQSGGGAYQSTQSYNSAPPTYNYAPQQYGSSFPSQTYNSAPQTYSSSPPAYSSAPPRTVMTNTGQRITFDTNDQIDMSKLTMDREGRVFDGSGRLVGHISNPSPGPSPNTSRSDGLEHGVPPPLVTAPPKAIDRPVPQAYTNTTRDAAAVVEKQSGRSAKKAAARAAKAKLLASREADLSARRAKVESRIRTEHQEGRLSDEQFNELLSNLESTVQTEQDFKRDKVLKDREMRSLYRQWDTMMADIDDDLRKNARSAVGLRTR